MSRAPRPTPQASTPVDPRENPGSYIRQDDGSFVQDGTATVSLQADGASVAAPGPVLPANSAAAIAAALAEVGHEVPPAIEANMAPAIAAPSEVITETGAGASTLTPEA